MSEKQRSQSKPHQQPPQPPDVRYIKEGVEQDGSKHKTK